MNSIGSHRQIIKHSSTTLPLFGWADEREKRVSISTPAKRIAREFGLSPAHAQLIAANQGWRPNDE